MIEWKEKKYNFKLSCSYYLIYDENLYDLLSPFENKL